MGTTRLLPESKSMLRCKQLEKVCECKFLSMLDQLGLRVAAYAYSFIHQIHFFMLISSIYRVSCRRLVVSNWKSSVVQFHRRSWMMAMPPSMSIPTMQTISLQNSSPIQNCWLCNCPMPISDAVYWCNAWSYSNILRPRWSSNREYSNRQYFVVFLVWWNNFFLISIVQRLTSTDSITKWIRQRNRSKGISAAWRNTTKW